MDSDAAVQALTFMRDAIYADGVVPPSVLTWQEEQTRFAFQNGEAAFMRNWPYAYALLQDPSQSSVAGRFAVAPMPAGPGGTPTAALGGSALAINAFSDQPDDAYPLIDFLLQPEQMLERARVAGQFRRRPALYDTQALADALTIPPADARAVIEHAVPRPVTPVYTQLSEILQVATAPRADSPAGAARRAARGGRRRCERCWRASSSGRRRHERRPGRRAGHRAWRHEARLGWALALPALVVIALVALFPIGWTFWESLHLHDLRMPWLGRPFVGSANYVEALGDARFSERHRAHGVLRRRDGDARA